ncbi:hypothetical protein CYY_003472 [Polysphondylium violaceum]|uniref:Methyltransferase small domain-containing protein n=1 Tax=Polysphondylium violaceum TaxID=133409 RepID=A0A8J4UUA3_9MYCE|nr:hypothetical protein CYY_003472 [Polysphondylium violaceum]
MIGNDNSTEIQLRENWQNQISKLLNEATSIKGQYEYNVGGKTLKIHPNVYSPKYFPESYWYAKNLSASVIQKDKKFLEVGLGSGIISLFVRDTGAQIFGVDINPDAVDITKQNFRNNNQNGLFQISDIYNDLDQDLKFDYIFWNHPWQNDKNSISKELRTEKTLDEGYVLLKRYVAQARSRLTPTGRLLLGTCSHAGSIDKIYEIARDNKFQIEILVQGNESIGENVQEIYYILQFNPIN